MLIIGLAPKAASNLKCVVGDGRGGCALGGFAVGLFAERWVLLLMEKILHHFE